MQLIFWTKTRALEVLVVNLLKSSLVLTVLVCDDVNVIM
jgi:hypothetical protein